MAMIEVNVVNVLGRSRIYRLKLSHMQFNDMVKFLDNLGTTWYPDCKEKDMEWNDRVINIDISEVKV